MCAYSNEISDKQERAIDLILSGLPDRGVGERVGVTRQCVNRWRNHHEGFRGALKERRLELMQESRNDLRGLVGKAILVLEDLMENGSERMRLEAAKTVLKATGMLGQVKETKEEGMTAEELLLQAIGEFAEERGIYKPVDMPRRVGGKEGVRF